MASQVRFLSSPAKAMVAVPSSLTVSVTSALLPKIMLKSPATVRSPFLAPASFQSPTNLAVGSAAELALAEAEPEAEPLAELLLGETEEWLEAAANEIDEWHALLALGALYRLHAFKNSV